MAAKSADEIFRDAKELDADQIFAHAPDAPDASKQDGGALDYAKRSVNGFSASMDALSPFSGLTDKLGAGSGALGRAAYDLVHQKPTKPLSQYYSQALDANQRGREKDIEDSPLPAKALGYAGGALRYLAAGPVGLADETLLGAGSRILGNAAVGALDRGTSNPNQLFDSEEAAAGGETAGGTQAAFEALIPAVKLLGPAAKAFARNRARKAATGQGKRFEVAMQNTGAATEDMSLADKAADYLLGDNTEKTPILGYFDNPESIHKKLIPAAAEEGQAIKGLRQQIDDAYPRGVASSERVAQGFEDYAESLPISSQTIPVIKRIQNDAAMMRLDPKMNLNQVEQALSEGMEGPGGPLTMEQVHEKKGGYPFKPTDSSKQAYGKEGSNAMYGVLRREENLAADTIANDPNASEELRASAGQFKQMKAESQSALALLKAATDRVEGNQVNRWLSPSDQMMAGLFGGGLGLAEAGRKIATGEDPTKALESGLMLGLPAAIIHKQFRTRGPAFMARSAHALEQAINGTPSASAKAIRNALRQDTGLTASRIQQRIEDAKREQVRRQNFGPTNP